MTHMQTDRPPAQHSALPLWGQMFSTHKNTPKETWLCERYETATCFLFQGTVIRVFSVPEGQKLYEFRRGMKRCVLT